MQLRAGASAGVDGAAPRAPSPPTPGPALRVLPWTLLVGWLGGRWTAVPGATVTGPGCTESTPHLSPWPWAGSAREPPAPLPTRRTPVWASDPQLFFSPGLPSSLRLGRWQAPPHPQLARPFPFLPARELFPFPGPARSRTAPGRFCLCGAGDDQRLSKLQRPLDIIT